MAGCLNPYGNLVSRISRLKDDRIATAINSTSFSFMAMIARWRSSIGISPCLPGTISRCPLCAVDCLGPLLVPPFVQRVSQVYFFAHTTKDVAWDTSFAIPINSYTSSVSLGPHKGWHVGAYNLSTRVGTRPLGPYNHRIFTRPLCSSSHRVLTYMSSP